MRNEEGIFMKYNIRKFAEGLDRLGYQLDDRQYRQFLTFYDMLTEKNRVMNLTAITDYEEVVSKHFLDSLSISNVCSKFKGKLLDLGTGAGFPGIPLKIAYPDLQITLVDSLNKRVRFLEEVIDALELKKIIAVHGRAEELARQKEYRESYRYVVSRAVANISTLSEYCLPFVEVGGDFIAYKSGQIEEELSDGKYGIKLLGGRIERLEQFTLPDTDVSRSLVLIRKIGKTPKTYPRKAGTPAREPLGRNNNASSK